MIKVIVCDGDGTLQFPKPPSDIVDLLSSLERLNIKLAVASNEQSKRTILRRFLQSGVRRPDFIVTPQDMPINTKTGKRFKKPFPGYVNLIQEMSGVEKNEIVYLGDDDRTDIFCAINAKVLPLAAKYSDAGKLLEYGLPVKHPKALTQYLSTFGQQESPYFGWVYNTICPDTNKVIDVRTLFYDHKLLGLTTSLKDYLKNKVDVRVGKNRIHLGSILFHYLVSQAYLSGLITNIDIVTVYPGHRSNSSNQILNDFSYILKSAFQQNFIPDLLIRHTDAKASHLISGSARDIYEQFRTIFVNSQYTRNIVNKTVLVLDDFTTSGCSLETARRILLMAGASNISSLAIAKYRNDYLNSRITRDWDPFKPCTLGRDEINVIRSHGTINYEADEFFQKNIWPVYSS